MHLVVNNTFKAWLKGSTNIKLSSDAAILCIIYEGITNYASLVDFDKKIIKSLPTTCKGTINAITENLATGFATESDIIGANISSISVCRLIVEANASKYFTSIDRVMTPAVMHYTNVLSNFKIDHESHVDPKDEDTPKAPSINDKDNDLKVIKCPSIFKD